MVVAAFPSALRGHRFVQFVRFLTGGIICCWCQPVAGAVGIAGAAGASRAAGSAGALCAAGVNHGVDASVLVLLLTHLVFTALMVLLVLLVLLALLVPVWCW